MNMDYALLISIVLALGIGAQWLAWYLKQPSILFLLLIGIVIGPVTGIFDADKVLGDMLFPFISLGVAIILFEGALTLEFHELSNHGKVVPKLVTIGVLITITILGLATYLLFDVSLSVAILFGALVCVTGPTVIMPILRSVRPNKSISNILRWEGIIIDPIGAIAVVLVYEYIISGRSGVTAMVFAKIILISLVLGFLGAMVLSNLIKRHMLPEYLQNVFTLAFVLLLFSISNAVEHESGLLTVTVLGVLLANWPKFPKNDLLNFKESLSVLLISMLFIVLATRVNLSAFLDIGLKGIVILLIAMFIARPLAVWASTYGSKLMRNEKLMLSWIAPRGIVAAAISSLLVIRLEEYQLQGAELLVPLVFLIIIGTVLVQSLGAKYVGDYLGVRSGSANGVLIVGSNPVAMMLANSLEKKGFEVILAHNDYGKISKARMKGLKTYYGHPVSEHADRHLDLSRTGYLFTMSDDRELNTMCEQYFKHLLGAKNVYRLNNGGETEVGGRIGRHDHWQVPFLFGENITADALTKMLESGAKTKITNITNTYQFEQFETDNPDSVVLYTITKTGNLKVFSTAEKPKVENGASIVALVTEKLAEKPPEKPDTVEAPTDALSAIRGGL